MSHLASGWMNISYSFSFIGPMIVGPMKWAFMVAQMLKKSTCNAGNLGLIPVLGRSLEKGIATHSRPLEKMATHSRILAWRIPWTI